MKGQNNGGIKGESSQKAVMLHKTRFEAVRWGRVRSEWEQC
jgi:hypothetical protein